MEKEEYLGVEYREDCTIKLFSGGKVTVDYGDKGKTVNVLEESGSNLPSAIYSGTYEPSKLEKISTYLYNLCTIQQSGHDVHQEIDEALKMYREEAGI